MPIAATDVKAMVDWAVNNHMDFVVVAPDDPLALGMVDELDKAGIPAFGPNAAAAIIEASKSFSKTLMEKYHIPIENVYRHFDVTGKHCPSYLVNAQKWAEFKKRLEVKIMDNTPSGAHKEGVEWAVKNGILTGNSEGDLMLSQPVTRQQMCTMLHRLWELIERT